MLLNVEIMTPSAVCHNLLTFLIKDWEGLIFQNRESDENQTKIRRNVRFFQTRSSHLKLVDRILTKHFYRHWCIFPIYSVVGKYIVILFALAKSIFLINKKFDNV